MKKKLFNIIMSMFLFVPIMLFSACGDGGSSGGSTDIHDATKWFTESELVQKGLSGLTLPTGLTGTINTYTSWYNNGYTFSQDCPDVETFTQNAQAYLDYFTQNYDGYFGYDNGTIMSSSAHDEYWKSIKQSNNLEDYYGNNPCKLYKFYYVTNKTLDNDGFFVEGIYLFEIRYDLDTSADNYKFKLYIEEANTNHYGNMTYHYKMSK